VAERTRRLRKLAPALGATMHAVQAVVFYAVGLPWPALASVGSVFWFGGCAALLARGRPRLAMVGAWVEVAAHSAGLTLFLGVDAGYLMYWVLLASAPFLVFRPREPERWVLPSAALLGGPVLLALFTTTPPVHPLEPWLRNGLAWMNLVGSGVGLVSIVAYFARETDRAEAALAREQARSEALLHSTLPAPIVARLKKQPGRIADQVDEACVLFADIVGFTPLAATLPGEELVDLLDVVFSRFDRLAAAEGLEKIKTIGDAYMVVAGLPLPHEEPVPAMARVAIRMRDAVREVAETRGVALDVRIGFHVGPVVAGVIGEQRLSYDLWGDTVNLASRMESHGEPGRIQVTEAVVARLGEGFQLVERGPVAVKGKGDVRTWLLEPGLRAPPRPPAAPSATP